MNGAYAPTNRLMVATSVNGNRQYPSKQILWKKLMVPPSSCPLRAITAPPSHTITKTISNRRVLSSAYVPEESTLENKTEVSMIRKKLPKKKIRHLHRKYQSKNERPPQVPVPHFLPLLFKVIRLIANTKLHWIYYYS